MARASMRSVPPHAPPQPQQRYRHKQQKQKSLPSHVQQTKPIAPSPGSNWKSAVQTREHQSRKPGHKHKKPKKASSDPRDSKLVHVVAASPRKQARVNVIRALGRMQRAFPRGKPSGSATVVAASTAPAVSQTARLDASTATASTSSLDDEILTFARFVALSPQERAFRARTFRELKELICGAFSSATVQLYGSSSNGLETFRSDLDITVGNISLSDSLRSDVHSALAAQRADDSDDDDADAVDPASDDDYEDEHYIEPSHLPVRKSSAPTSSVESESQDEEPSFSLNIATPSTSRHRGGQHQLQHAHQPAATAASGKSPWNPTLRRQKLRVLRALQYLLQLQRPQLQVKCLSKAKIPILMVLDPASQLSIDIGVNREAFEASDHGRTTSLVLELQRVLGGAFAALVTLLKEFLHQFELDKPFTGGLGSFRLYIMVASLFPLEQCSATGRVRVAAARVPSVSALLLAFFHVFGNKRRPQYLQSSTVLRLPFADSCVDFASVFRLDDCVDAFAMAHDILSETRSLGSILFEDRLADERARARKATPPAPERSATHRVKR